MHCMVTLPYVLKTVWPPACCFVFSLRYHCPWGNSFKAGLKGVHSFAAPLYLCLADGCFWVVIFSAFFSFEFCHRLGLPEFLPHSLCAPPIVPYFFLFLLPLLPLLLLLLELPLAALLVLSLLFL